ncbi:hypothetical protein EPI10_016970 [Gossypium australe]|uniref:Uncharacterized protein n=1 Tax=Gossypium australe TaxID=47621 RepID=A0A5B6VQF1_9ROSI|nr:hypothetical protein EPI10_016970 [Gossypium australe]
MKCSIGELPTTYLGLLMARKNDSIRGRVLVNDELVKRRVIPDDLMTCSFCIRVHKLSSQNNYTLDFCY